jgi:hypothetical protein
MGKSVTPMVNVDNKPAVLKAFREIPGIGRSIAEDLWNIGLRAVSDLQDADPELLYRQVCLYQGVKVDRCLLYTFRCAVYYASNSELDPELLKWWNWTDEKQAALQTVT